ncbi:GspMb/PilO family protein [Chromobacterium sp. LK1]|uniref:GspMb/PilO family protein n=1 Tax=Chromobacterium sp. LK1 TaxID=1628193 RepID=UPI000ACE7C85|nr:GspMb/PilO family protein [Chromobacterium sp. LK1]
MRARWRTVTAALITAWRRTRQVRVQPESGQWRHWGSRLRWQRQVLACHLGRGGQLALAACGLLLGYGALAQWPQQQDLQQRRQRLSAPPRALPAAEPTARAQQLRAQLSEDMNPRKQALLAQLSQAGLIVFDAAYRDEPEAGGKLRRVSVELSAAGRYPELMAALVALKAQPLLRLETLTLERAQTTNVMLSIRMRLSMLGAGQ